jgi:hypothetical protein
MSCRSFYYFLRRKKKQKDTARNNRVLRALYSKRKRKTNSREAEKENCVCMRHMELLVVDTRRQAAVID